MGTVRVWGDPGGPRRSGQRRDRWARLLASAAMVVLAAGCGGATGDADVPAAPAADAATGSDAAGDDPADDGAHPALEDVPETSSVDPDEPPEPVHDAEPAPVGAGGLVCALDTDPGGVPAELDGYLDTVGHVNLELELLVLDMDGAVTVLEEGGSDGPSLAGELEEIALRFAELTVPVIGITPPEGTEDWHAQVVGSWLLVCQAILDGHAGAAEGDMERFERFVASLREFPSLLNHLHANAALGPFEEG